MTKKSDKKDRAETALANGAGNGHAHPVAQALDTKVAFDLDLLKRLTETPGTSGREERVRELVLGEMRPLVDEISVDALGNVIGVKHGTGKTKVMLAAHMDEIGFVVKHIDDKGYLRLQPVGGHDASVEVAQRVLVHTQDHGTLRGAMMAARKPIHLQRDKAEGKVELADMFVDLGYLNGEAVKGMVEIGDFVTMDRTLEVIGDCVISKALDDRSGIFVMLETLKRLQTTAPNATVYAVATVQEEVGLRGAMTAAYHVDADVTVALDTTLAVEMPGSAEQDAVTRLGQGVAIKVMDSSHISNPKLLRHMREIARRENIPHQMEVLPAGGTDAAAMQKARRGTAAITLSLPSRYVHTVNEMLSLTDIQADIDLLTKFLGEVQPSDYQL